MKIWDSVYIWYVYDMKTTIIFYLPALTNVTQRVDAGRGSALCPSWFGPWIESENTELRNPGGINNYCTHRGGSGKFFNKTFDLILCCRFWPAFTILKLFVSENMFLPMKTCFIWGEIPWPAFGCKPKIMFFALHKKVFFLTNYMEVTIVN